MLDRGDEAERDEPAGPVWRQALVRGAITGAICAVVWRLFDSDRTIASALIFGLIVGVVQIVWSVVTAPQARRQQRERRRRREERARRQQ